VTRLDPTTGRRDTISFETGAQPLAVAVSPDAVYVTLSGTDQLARIDPESLQYDVIPAPDRPVFLAWGAGSLWSVADAGYVYSIDPATFTITAYVEVPGAKGIAIVGNAAWVTAGATNELVKIDLATYEVVGRFPVGAVPDAIVADGDAVWMTYRGGGAIARFDTVSEQVTNEVMTGTGPSAIAIDGDRIWVGDADEGTLVLVDRTSATVVQSVAAGRRVLGLEPLGGAVWVTAADDSSVAQILVFDQAPTQPRAEIVGIETVGERYVPTFTVQNFTPSIGGDLHVHLYWNTSLVADVGMPGAGPWLVWDQPERVDNEFFDIANRPEGATAVCIVVANSAHEVADVDGDGAPDYDTGNCMQLPDPA